MDRLQSIMENMTITSTPDGKSNRAQPPPTNFETPSKQNMSTTNVFIDGSLDEQRKAVQEDLGPIPQVTVDFMLDHIIPNSNVDVESTVAKLKDAGALVELAGGVNSWKASNGKSPSQLFKEGNPDTNNEAKVFGKLKDIYKSIISCTQFQDGKPRTPTLVFEQNPNRAPLSDSAIRSRPDGYGVLKEAVGILPPSRVNRPPQQDDDFVLRSGSRISKNPDPEDSKIVQWYDIVCVEEYKVDDSAKDRNDNVLKILWSLHHIMNVDHRRRFTFGITVENNNTRIWFACRQIVFVTKVFDINEDPSRLIRLIASLAFATPIQLGYDPTMSLHWDAHTKEHYYKIQCTTKKPDGSTRLRVYRTLKVISDCAYNLRGRATRVYLVKALSKTDGLPLPDGPPLVLKDSWVDINRAKEGDILENLLSGASRDDRNRFSAVYQHSAVQIDLKDDTTHEVILKNQDIPLPDDQWFSLQNSSFTHSSDKVTSTTGLFHLSISESTTVSHSKTTTSKTGSSKKATSQRLTAARGGLKHNNLKEIKRPIEYSPKVHYRIIFMPDDGVSLEQLLDRGEATSQIVYKALSDIVQALQFMAKRGYVHRDVSIGNIIWCDRTGQAKLIDLDSAKPYATGASSFVRTGTYAFMAAEVMKRKHSIPEYARQNANKPFIYHPIHDLESLWWVGVYCFVSHYPAPYDTTVIRHLSGSYRSVTTYRDFNDTELAYIQLLISHQQKLFPSLYDAASYDLRMEEILNETSFKQRTQNLPPNVQVLGSCLENIRKCICCAYEEIQSELPRAEAAYFTEILRIPDPTTARINNETPTQDSKKPVHDVVLGILGTLRQTAGTQNFLLWPLSSTEEERSAWAITQETKSKLRPRIKPHGIINMDLGEVWEEN